MHGSAAVIGGGVFTRHHIQVKKIFPCREAFIQLKQRQKQFESYRKVAYQAMRKSMALTL